MSKEHGWPILTALLAVLLLAAALIHFHGFVIFLPTGAFVASGLEWENKIELQAASDQQQIIQHIIFGEYKPTSCADGIYVEASGQAISFTTQNEIYSDGFCSEADIIFDNIIYQPPAANSEPQTPSFAIMTGAAGAETITYTIYYGEVPVQEEAQPAPEVLPEEQQLQTQEFQIQQQATCNSTPTDCCDITSAGTYTLQNNIANNTATACINITASDVTFDGQGYTIDSNDTTNTYGVYVRKSGTTLTNVTVKNVTVTNWHIGIYYGVAQNGSIETVNVGSNTLYGIYLQSSSNNNLTNNNMSSNTNYGIFLALSSNNNNLTSNTANSNSRGIYLYFSSNNNILTNNTANSNNAFGINLESSANYNMLTNNTANSNSQHGIYLSSSSNNMLTSNTANSNTLRGIYFESSSNNNLTSNTANNNANTGIYLFSSSNNTLASNTVNSNTNGIYLYSSSNYNNLTSNTANSNNEGVILDSSNNNNLTSNTANSNTLRGIYLESSSNNTLTSNNASSNSQKGIYLYTSNSNNLTSNTASGPSQTYGFQITASNSSTFTNNVANSNSNSGFFLSAASKDNILTNNSASGSTTADVQVSSDSQNNTFTNQTLGSTYATKASFTYSGAINLKGVSSPPADPTNYTNISKYIDAANSSANAWLYINISYADADIPAGIGESTVALWRNSSGTWSSSVGSPNSVDTTNNYVYANISSFGSVFAPLGTAIVNQAPQINLNLPENNAQINNTQSINFNFTATDDLNTTLNCSIYLDSALNQTNSSTINNTLTNFLISGISYGTHNWSVNCSDGTLSNVSDTRYFTTVEEEEEEESSWAGGEAAAQTYEAKIEPGAAKTFELKPSDVVSFSIGTASHSVKVRHIDVVRKTCTLTIYSEPITVLLSVGESKDIDLDGDGSNDLRLTLVDLAAHRVEINISYLAPAGQLEAPVVEIVQAEQPQQQQPQRPATELSATKMIFYAPGQLLGWLLIGVAILLAISFYAFRKPK